MDDRELYQHLEEIKQKIEEIRDLLIEEIEEEEITPQQDREQQKKGVKITKPY